MQGEKRNGCGIYHGHLTEHVKYYRWTYIDWLMNWIFDWSFTSFSGKCVTFTTAANTIVHGINPRRVSRKVTVIRRLCATLYICEYNNCLIWLQIHRLIGSANKEVHGWRSNSVSILRMDAYISQTSESQKDLRWKPNCISLNFICSFLLFWLLFDVQ